MDNFNLTQTGEQVQEAINNALNTLVYRGAIANSADLNDIVTAGFYSFVKSADGAVPSNAPEDIAGVSFMMMVYGYTGTVQSYTVQTIVGASLFGATVTPVYKYRIGTYDKIYTAWSAVGELAQETGSSETQAMSQKAVTEAIAAISGDTDENMIRIFNSMLTNGVFATDDETALAPTAIGGLQVTTNPGTMLIEGYSKKVAKATRTYLESESDRVEVNLYRLDTTTGTITAYWRSVIVEDDIIISKADGAEIPIRGGGYYDILICKVTIPAGTTEITSDMVEDLRANEDYCGFVKLKL